MKKIAFLATLAMLASLFSFGAFAEDLTGPGSKELTLNATKDVAYTLSIPSGTATVNIAAGAQEIGEIGLTAANFTTGSIDVEVTSGDDGFALVNGEVSVAYTLDAPNGPSYKYNFTAVTSPLTKVNLTITNPADATIAGTYTDTLTFSATPNNLQ